MGVAVVENSVPNMKGTPACFYSIAFLDLPTFLKEEPTYHVSQNCPGYAFQLWVLGPRMPPPDCLSPRFIISMELECMCLIKTPPNSEIQ